VELIVANFDFEATAKNAALAVRVGGEGLSSEHRALEETGDRARKCGDVPQSDRLASDSDVGRTAVAAGGRGGRGAVNPSGGADRWRAGHGRATGRGRGRRPDARGSRVF